MKIKNSDCMKIYKKLRTLALRAYKEDDYEKSLQFIYIASELMYRCSLIYADNGLEKILYRIGKKYTDKENFKNIERNIIFYDYFGWDNRGLSLIYVKALYELGYKITYIVCNKHKRDYERISKYVLQSGGSICIVERSSYPARIKYIAEIIKKSGGAKAFMHTYPSDVAGIAVFSALEGKMERFLINITDHAYWLGKSSFDKCIEFRDIGAGISANYRKIDKEKLAYLPYYPATNDSIKFQGFPFNLEGKKIIYTGGALYKISGSKKYYEIIKYILDKYDDTVVLYTGNGDTTKILKFIADNNYEKRFFYQSERKDFEGLIKNCYFYLGTYPMGGGLMTQYAVHYNKFPVCLSDEKEDLISLFMDREKVQDIAFTDLKSLYTEIDMLLTDKEYLDNKVKKLQGALISEDNFNNALKNLLVVGDTEISYNIDGTDIKTIRKQDLQGMGITEEELYHLLFGSENRELISNFVFRYIKYMFFQKTQSER